MITPTKMSISTVVVPPRALLNVPHLFVVTDGKEGVNVGVLTFDFVMIGATSEKKCNAG